MTGKADVGTGITIAFATSGMQADIADFNHGEISRGTSEAPHMGSSDGIPMVLHRLINYGTFEIEILFDPDDAGTIKSAMQGSEFEQVTITFPIPPGSPTLTSGATLIGQGKVTAFTPRAPLEDVMRASITVTWQGDPAPSWTAAS